MNAPVGSIVIDQAALDALASDALMRGHRFHTTATPIPGGRFLLQLDPDVAKRLRGIRRKGESYSRLIRRLAREATCTS